MKVWTVILGLLIVFTCLLLASEKSPDYEKNWPQWRGPHANGVSPNGNPPIDWSEDKNIKWKIEIPGYGHATPIVWGDQMFILTAIPVTKQEEKQEQEEQQPQGRRRGMPSRQTEDVHKYDVLSINRHDGKIQWQKTVKEEIPEERTHELGSWASNSPVTDGKHVYAYFGSRGLFCLDMKGNLKWERDFGQMSKRMSFGEGSSPVLYDNKIFVLWDHEGESFLFAIDKKTGKDIWKVARDERTSWATPFIVEVNEKTQVITSATSRIRSYDAATGDLIWECSGMTANVIPQPVVANDIIYLMSGFRGSALLAIRLSEAKGDITDSDAIEWEYNKDTSYTPSPLLLDNMLYFLRLNNGVLSCLDARDGKVYYSKQKLEGIRDLYTSIASAQDRIFILGKNGIMYVVKHGSEFTVLAKNELADNFHASPVILGENLYLRGYKYLYCIAQD